MVYDGNMDVGIHCSYGACNRLDFLPYVCSKCQLKYCQDHRLPGTHGCVTDVKQQQQQQQQQQQLKKTKEGVARCGYNSCQTVLDNALHPGVSCAGCQGVLYCLKHRHPSDHNCHNVATGKLNTGVATTEPKAKLVNRLREWANARQQSNGTAKRSVLKAFGVKKGDGGQKGVAQKALELGRLKKAAVGDGKLAEPSRVYVYAEAPPSSLADLQCSPLRKECYFAKTTSNGRVLDQVGRLLGEKNVNNQTENQDDRLRLFHVESGFLLESSRQFGEFVKNGDTVVLIRGLKLIE